MNLLILSNFYPPQAIGGYEQLCQEAAEGFVQRGHRVTVLTSNYRLAPQQPAREQIKGVSVVRSLFIEAPNDYYRPADFFLKRPGQEAHNQAELRRLVKEIQPDLIMVWGMWNLSRNLPKLAETLMPERTVYYICSYWPQDEDAHHAYWNLPANRSLTRLMKLPLKMSALRQLRNESYPPTLQMKHSASVSRYVRDRLVEAGKLPDKATVISNGIDPEPYLAMENRQFTKPLRLLYFGRLIADKGVHTAIEALGILKKQNQEADLQLTILGSGHPDYEAELRNLVQTYGLEKQVEFVASVPREEIPAWLQKHDIFLFTSIWAEPMARSVMEAMAAGMLVIGTVVGGQREMFVHGENALTFDAANAAQLAEQIRRALDNPTATKQIADTGRKLILEKFTLEKMVESMETYLEEVLQNV